LDYLRDILAYAEKAERFVEDVDFDRFMANDEKVLAVIRVLEVIGEAARQIPRSVRERYPEVPWQDMIGMRNVVIHGYFGVNTEVIWRTVHKDLPPLRGAVAKMLEDLERRAERSGR
jgi:uncharacterized protein with HEPN domain